MTNHFDDLKSRSLGRAESFSSRTPRNDRQPILLVKKAGPWSHVGQSRIRDIRIGGNVVKLRERIGEMKAKVRRFLRLNNVRREIMQIKSEVDLRPDAGPAGPEFFPYLH